MTVGKLRLLSRMVNPVYWVFAPISMTPENALARTDVAGIKNPIDGGSNTVLKIGYSGSETDF